ncbi:MAG: hypothetical protein QG652_196 [Pseudomonadota bacterium]|nr:hypothetical protein [Pseudomonadota bacterium]
MIVLDTHVLIWWLAGGKLSSKAQKIINKFAGKERSILVSSISAWEMAMLVDHGRLVLTMDVETWLETAKKIPSIQFVPIDNSIAIQSTRLPGDFHRDPADRMLVALARHWSAPIVTADEKILAYKYVKAVW